MLGSSSGAASFIKLEQDEELASDGLENIADHANSPDKK
jgi:hypothetical protein